MSFQGFSAQFKSVISVITLPSVLVCLCIAALAGAVCFAVGKKLKFPVWKVLLFAAVVFYVTQMFYLTVFSRGVGSDFAFELHLFWSYQMAMAGAVSLFYENMLNILLFLPLGLMLGVLIRRAKIAVGIGFGLSLAVEILQLVTKRGLFELDDLFHNTLGAFLGIVITVLLLRLFSKQAKKKDDILSKKTYSKPINL